MGKGEKSCTGRDRADRRGIGTEESEQESKRGLTIFKTLTPVVRWGKKSLGPVAG